jgi:hypothetical protein
VAGLIEIASGTPLASEQSMCPAELPENVPLFAHRPTWRPLVAGRAFLL